MLAHHSLSSVLPGGAVPRQADRLPYPLLAVMRHGPLHLHQADGLVVLHGHHAVLRLGLYATADRALAGESVLYLDGANAFDPFTLSRLARASGVSPRTVLEAIRVSRAFTCHQMARLVTERLTPAYQASQTRTIIVSGPLEAFYDETVPFSEAARLAREMAAALHRLARRGRRLLCLCPPLPRLRRSRTSLFDVLQAEADRVIRVEETGDGFTLCDEGRCSPKRWSIPRAAWDSL